MYNRYIRNDNGQYQRVPVQDAPPPPPPPADEAGFEPEFNAGPRGGYQASPPPPPPPNGKGILNGILEKFNIKDLDSGDLLLLFILFLLLREGADEELLIALGLLLIL